MNKHSHFKDLIKRPTEEWTLQRLEQLTIVELKEVCKLIGIGYCYTYKAGYYEAILVKTEIQRIVRPHWGTLEEQPTTEQIQGLANSYKYKELRRMCRQAGIYAPGTKYGMATNLINWNRGCIRLGRNHLERSLAYARKQPKQLSLKLF